MDQTRYIQCLTLETTNNIRFMKKDPVVNSKVSKMLVRTTPGWRLLTVTPAGRTVVRVIAKPRPDRVSPLRHTDSINNNNNNPNNESVTATPDHPSSFSAVFSPRAWGGPYCLALLTCAR